MAESVKDVRFGTVESPEGVSPTQSSQQANLEMIFDVPVTVSAELGSSVIRVKDLLNLCPGSVVELERLAGESIELKVNGVLIGKGDVVVVNENFGLRITEIVCTEERIKKLSE